MRVLIAIILLSSSFASRAQTKDFENYLKQVERNAKGLATMYFGVGTHVTGFEQVPGGAFHFLAHKKTGEQYSLYLRCSNAQYDGASPRSSRWKTWK